MVKTKREYILATFFLSGAAAIVSFVSLGTEGWVYADAYIEDDNAAGSIKFGLFAGTFYQEYGYFTNFYLTMVCHYELNACALLCGENMKENLKKLYYHNEDNQTVTDSYQCTYSSSPEAYDTRMLFPRAGGTNEAERVFINTGVWLCTIVFLVISAVMGLISAGLAVWNTATSPTQVLVGVISLYVYNGAAFFSILLTILLWGAMYVNDLIGNIPCYKTFMEGYSTANNAFLGYSYWILLVSLVLYLASMCLLFFRYYLISKEPKKVNVEVDSEDARIYLY